MQMNSKTYDFLKNFIIPLLTGGATFILTLGDIWHIAYAKEIGATLTALATLISFMLNSSSKAYFSDKEIVNSLNNRDTEIGENG